jgi:signal transduction histidine kinase
LTKRDGELNRRRSGIARRLLLIPPAFVVAMAVSALVVGVLAWLVLVSVPQVDLSLETATDGRWVVSGVPIGERAWLIGIRPGMEVESFAPAGGRPDRNWTSLAVSDGVVHLTVQRFYPPPDSLGTVLSLVALVGSIFAIGVAPSVAWWLLLTPALIGLAFASDLVTAPVSLIVGLAPPAIGGLSLIDPGRRIDKRLAGVGAGLISVAAGCWLIAYNLWFETWELPRQASAAIGIGLLTLGTAASVRQALWRARTRLGPAGGHPPAFLLLAATLDELVPGRARSRLSAIERERAVIATDLHGEVLPDLAAVIKDVEAGMNPADAAARLQSVASELRELMTERRLTVLEELGLVPALEWLAERIEERTNVTVELDIRGDGAARVPPDVELHVYRIAQQALDNALVHARPSRIRISIDVEAERLDLEVVDDGVGIAREAESRALRAGRVGIADMRQRAAAIGAALRIGGRRGGTTVALRWPA